MKRVTLLIGMGAALAVSACATPYGPYAIYDSVTPAVDMCEVDTLAEQRLAMLDEAHRYRVAIGADAGWSRNTSSTRTQELIAAFETDLDASYRFATTSCRTYNRCLEENSFHEQACFESAAMWHDSQGRFHDLSERLAVIRESIATQCDDCGRPSYPGYGRPHYGADPGYGYGYRPPYRGPDYGYGYGYGQHTGYYRRRSPHANYHRYERREDDLLGSVFSTSEGYDSSYHDGHH